MLRCKSSMATMPARYAQLLRAAVNRSTSITLTAATDISAAGNAK